LIAVEAAQCLWDVTEVIVFQEGESPNPQRDTRFMLRTCSRKLEVLCCSLFWFISVSVTLLQCAMVLISPQCPMWSLKAFFVCGVKAHLSKNVQSS